MKEETLYAALRREELWFHEVSQRLPFTRLIAIRFIRHSIWYLRSQHHHPDRTAATQILLQALENLR